MAGVNRCNAAMALWGGRDAAGDLAKATRPGLHSGFAPNAPERRECYAGRSEALSRDHRVPTRCSNQPCGLPAEWLLVPQLETQLCSHTRLCIGNAAPGDETAGLGCLRHQQLLNVRLQGVDGLHEW